MRNTVNPKVRDFGSGQNEEPRIYWSRNDECWVLAHEIRWRWRGRDIHVHAGFQSDLASIPFYIRPIIATYGNYNFGALCHDFVYGNKGVLPNGAVFTRENADRMFFDRIVIDGTSIAKATIMWGAVRSYPLNYGIFER